MRGLNTNPAWGITVVRVMMGIILVVAGYQKVTSPNGIGGFVGFVGSLGIPFAEVLGPMVPLLELIGGALVLVGLGARWVAIPLIVEFLVTTFVVKLPRPAPMGGWDSARIDLMLLAGAFMLLLAGSGKLSLDGLIRRR